jgi:hypothetical protein
LTEVTRYIWPAGAPAGVRVVFAGVVASPAPVAVFELSGVTYDTLETMDGSIAKAFFDMGLRPVSHQLRTVRIWFNSFIPQFEIRAPGYDCFKGDYRSYSVDPMAPSRMHSEVLLENLHTARPTMTQIHRCGLTRQVDCNTGALINSGTSGTSGMQFYNFRYPGAVVFDWNERQPPAARPPEVTVGASAPVSVDYIGAAADPLVPVAPFVDLWVHIELDLQTGFLTVNGKVDDYPAFEGYVTVNGQYGPFSLFELDGDNWVGSLLGGANRPFRRTVSLGSYAALK